VIVAVEYVRNKKKRIRLDVQQDENHDAHTIKNLLPKHLCFSIIVVNEIVVKTPRDVLPQRSYDIIIRSKEGFWVSVLEIKINMLQ